MGLFHEYAVHCVLIIRCDFEKLEEDTDIRKMIRLLHRLPICFVLFKPEDVLQKSVH